jgi:hypothetical protein
MRLLILCVLNFFFVSTVISQTNRQIKKELKSVTNEEDVERFKEKYEKFHPVYSYVLPNDTNYYKSIANKIKVGKVFTFIDNDGKKVFSKVVDTVSELVFTTQNISLQTIGVSYDYIDSLRSEIISSFNNGVDFDILVDKYSVDKFNKGIYSNMLYKFVLEEYKLKSQKCKKGELFTISIPSNNFFLVAIKLEDDRQLKFYRILTVTSN